MLEKKLLQLCMTKHSALP